MSTIRIWPVQHELEEQLRSMTEAELLGAEAVLGILHQYLDYTHFQKQGEVDVRALTKTLEELHEISGEILYHTFGRKDIVHNANTSKD
jgi:hypothetical protein